MDYTSRNIYTDDDGNTYRYIGRETDDDGTVTTEGTKITTTVTGDVWLEVSSDVFDADLSDEMIAVIEEYYPSLLPITTLRDVFPDSSIAKDEDDVVCFKTGIYDKIETSSGYGYNRSKKTSDYEFEMFYSLVTGDNIYNENPYTSDDI